MSFINTAGLEDIHEQHPVPEGRYNLVIADVKVAPAKNSGKDMMTIQQAIEGHPDAPPVYTLLPLADPDDEPKARNFKMLQLKRYLALVGIDYDPSEGFDSDDLYGVGFNAPLGMEEAMDSEGKPKDPPEFRNFIKLPKLQEE